jgi:hypothetical protein
MIAVTHCSGKHSRGKPKVLWETDCTTNSLVHGPETPVFCHVCECQSCGSTYTVHVSWCTGTKYER